MRILVLHHYNEEFTAMSKTILLLRWNTINTTHDVNEWFLSK